MHIKKVDFHAHPVTDAFRQAMTDLGIDPIAEDGFPLPEWNAEAHIEFMENAGIDYTFLSVPTPHIYNGDTRKASLAAREINLSVARIWQNYPNQFGFVACVPLPRVKDAIEELLYAMDELGTVVVKLATNPEPVTMDMLMMVAEDSHIVFGNNYPHSPANAIIAKKKHFDENDKYALIRELIYGSNYKQLSPFQIVTRKP